MNVIAPAGLAATVLIELRLVSIRHAAEGICLFEFRDPDGALLPSAEPGSHIDLHLPNGLTRSYSLLTPMPRPDHYLIGVKLDPTSRGGSAFLHERLRPGTRLRIGAPSNNFPLNEVADQSVLIAGGIGITPIWSMLQRLQELGRDWRLHYAVRSRAEALFPEALQALGARVVLHCDDTAGSFLDVAGIVAGSAAEADLYCCGPAPMLAAFEAACAGRPPERVHVEYFAPRAAAADEGGYEVELARSGRVLPIAPGQSILDALLDAGVDCSFACMQGTCGSCETRVLAGEPDHRDALLSAAQRSSGKVMLICCSGSRSDRLVLDL